jgi:hypothetical protein
MHVHSLWLLLLAGLMMSGCSGASDTLTTEQRNKLHPRLQRLLDGTAAATAFVTTTRPDGTIAYAVLLRVDDPAAIRESGLPVQSIVGSTVTARLTLSELRRAARLPTVQSIAPARRTELQPDVE